MYNKKNGNVLIFVKEMNWMGTEMRIKGFRGAGSKDAFCCKGYQHIGWMCFSEEYDKAYSCSYVDTHALTFFLFIFLSPAFLSHVLVSVGFLQSGPAQWACMRPLGQQKYMWSNCLLWGGGLRKTTSKLKCSFSFLDKSPFLCLPVILGVFLFRHWWHCLIELGP